MSKNDESELEIDAEASEGPLDTADGDANVEEEIIPDDDANKPERKKVAALRARHALEDYFDSVKINKVLNYLDEDNNKRKPKEKGGR